MAAVEAIHAGGVPRLRTLLTEHPVLATARIGDDDPNGMSRTPLHWAASSNDVAVLDALLDLGADIEAPGAVIAGGTPLADARAFGNWAAGLRLVERGARTTLTDSATLGLIDRIEAAFGATPYAGREEPRVLGRLPRRPSGLRRVPARPRRGPELGPRVGATHPARRRPTTRSHRSGHVTARARRQVRR